MSMTKSPAAENDSQRPPGSPVRPDADNLPVGQIRSPAGDDFQLCRSGTWVINAAFLSEIKDSCVDSRQSRDRLAATLIEPMFGVREARVVCEQLERWRDSLAMLFTLEQTYGYVELPDESLNADEHLQRALFEQNFDSDGRFSDAHGDSRCVSVAAHTPIDLRFNDDLPSLMPPSCLLGQHDHLYTDLQQTIDQLVEIIVHGGDVAALRRSRQRIIQLIDDMDQHDCHERKWMELTPC